MPTLRINDALLIAQKAFFPLHCIAWATEYSGELSLTVIDSATSRVVSRARVKQDDYADARHLGAVLQQARQQILGAGLELPPWQMP